MFPEFGLAVAMGDCGYDESITSNEIRNAIGEDRTICITITT